MGRRKGAAVRSGMLGRIVGLSATMAALYGGTAYGLNYTFPMFGDEVKTVLNSTLTVGAGVRAQSPSGNLIGKSNLNPNVCGAVIEPGGAVGAQYMSCQATFETQVFPSSELANSPGAASVNSDDGDLNYKKWDFFSGVGKASEDLKIDYRGFGVFGRMLYFNDVVNHNFQEYHPNRITPQNLSTSGFSTSVVQLPVTYIDLLGLAAIPNPVPPNPLSYPGQRIYGPGQVVVDDRSGEAKREVGEYWQFLDSYFYGQVPLWGDRELSFKLGRQTINWGESTTLVTNSINSINPVNVNNFLRIGNQIEEDFIPLNMASLSFSPIDNFTVDGYYQFEWQPTQIPPDGSYFSSLDLSTLGGQSLNLGFGGAAEDPAGVGRLLYNPLAQLGSASATMQGLDSDQPDSSKHPQFGFKLDYYADWLNQGTDLAAYFERYNSRLPFLSTYAANPSCARAAGSATGLDATHFYGDTSDQSAFVNTCPDIPLVYPLGTALTNNGSGPTNSEPQYGSAAALDSIKYQFGYPTGINMAGLSFNTTIGSWALQGEVAYRPHQPLQVDVQDLVFAAAGPTLDNCTEITCSGTTPLAGSKYADYGFDPTGQTVGYESSDCSSGKGPCRVSGYAGDTINVGQITAFGGLLNTFGAGALPSSARAFPNFVVPYRGGVVGQNPGCPYGAAANSSSYQPGSPCWIQGWQRLQTFEFNLGTTKVFGKTDNFIHADQVQLITETGAMWVPQLPPLDQLQFEAFGTNYAASAGADGSGANGSQMACSQTPDCVVGPDGLRFNPHQQDPTGYPDKFSWGYRVITIAKYESVFPGISFQPTLFYSQDVMGTSPGPGGNFVAGSKVVNAMLETRYKSAVSFTMGYTWFWGGGQYNPLADRDYLQFFVKYQF